MGTFSSITKRNIFTKPFLISSEEFTNNDINLVGYDPLRNDPFIDESVVNFKYGNSSSPKLLNWVEPYVIAGVNKTLFYTEVNSGLKIGDKVFIINGAYDSNLLIQDNKYKRGYDGYIVLFVDKCRVVLDIDFTGYLPSSESDVVQENFDNFVKV